MKKIFLALLILVTVNNFAQDIDWTGKYVFEKKKGDIVYKYVVKIDPINGEYIANVQINGGLTRQDILAFTKLESDRIHIFFSSYKDYDEIFFKYGDPLMTIYRKANLEIEALSYGFDPLPPKTATLRDSKEKKEEEPQFTFNGHLETYYAWDTDKDKSTRQFGSTSNIRDQFRLNIAQLSGSYTSNRFRGIVTLHIGDLVSANWPDDNAMRYIQEANVGFRAAKGLWFDFGYFPTHVGTESVFPRYNFFNTLALTTYFEPTYQSGIKVSYTKSKFYSQLYLLNGFNQLGDNNKNKSVGLQLGFKPNDKVDFTYNNLIGNEQPSDLNNPKVRIYNNLIVKIAPGKKVDMLLGIDYALQEKSAIADTTQGASLISGLFAIRFKPSDKFSISARYDYHSDKDGFLSGTFLNSDSVLTGLEARGFTLCFEYKPVDFGYVRLEGRYIMTQDNQKIFFDNSNTRFESVFSIGASF